MPLAEIIIRGLTLLLHLLRFIYWYRSELKIDNERPLNKPFSYQGQIQRLGFHAVFGLLGLQLLGLDVLPFGNNIFVQLFGLLLTVIGIHICILARHQLGLNWAPGANYQIKKDQVLVTKGIYSHIRHPIYTGILLSFIGGELVAQSYLALILLFPCFFWAYRRAKQEETILAKHFGEKYEKYKRKTGMMIPNIFKNSKGSQQGL